MSELAVVSIVVSLAVMLSQVMAVESAELQRLQGEAAAMAAVVLWLATGRYIVHVENLEYADAQAYSDCRKSLLAAGWANA